MISELLAYYAGHGFYPADDIQNIQVHHQIAGHSAHVCRPVHRDRRLDTGIGLPMKSLNVQVSYMQQFVAALQSLPGSLGNTRGLGLRRCEAMGVQSLQKGLPIVD